MKEKMEDLKFRLSLQREVDDLEFKEDLSMSSACSNAQLVLRGAVQLSRCLSLLAVGQAHK